MILRSYTKDDCESLMQLFYDTVHTVNRRDYSEAQLNAWADGNPDKEAWHQSLQEHVTLIAEEEGKIVGFADMAEDGYLDRLYVHKDYQGRGIAAALCEALERQTATRRVTTHASITAKPFFEKRGYGVIRSQQVERHGVLLTNFVMEKKLPFKITKICDRPDLLAESAAWFADKWGIPEEVYKESMQAYIDNPADVPQWYIVLDEDGKIIAGTGIIDNDFHERKDLSPNLCALYVEPDRRGRGIAGKLLSFALAEMRSCGFEELYLITDHTSFYERYGWRFIGMVKEEGGGECRMYEKDTAAALQ